jgi:CRP-like cAMP-binding protein
MHPADFVLHAANLLLLVSYLARDMLVLRWFAVGASVMAMPYFLFQRTILWPPVVWGIVFTGINLYQIALIYLSRRPVVLSEDEQRLYDLGFHSIAKREFLSLVLAGEWKTAAPGDQPLVEGEVVRLVCIAIRGRLRVTRKGEDLGELQVGQSIGLAPALLGNPGFVTVSFTEPGRYIQWPLAAIRTFLDAKPELRDAVQRLVNRDLAGKLERLMS